MGDIDLRQELSYLTDSYVAWRSRSRWFGRLIQPWPAIHTLFIAGTPALLTPDSFLKSDKWCWSWTHILLDQRSTCRFVALKGLPARAFHDLLTTVLGPDTVASSVVAKYLRQRKFPLILVSPPRSHWRPLSIKQFLMSARNNYSLLFKSSPSPVAFSVLQSIDT
jgi:hypothetical protein